MTCEECGAPVAPGERRCAACAAEEPLFAAYARSIDVPDMWGEVARRIRRDAAARRRRWWPLAAAALLLVAIGAALLVRRESAVERGGIVAEAGERYRRAIAGLEPRAGAAAAPMLAELDAAVARADRAAARAPHDPMAVTRMVAAYDAKVRLLREVRR